MTTKRFCALLVGLFVSLTSFGQPQELRKIDQALSGVFREMIHADYLLRVDSLAPLFKAQLLEQLLNPITFDNSLDSLSIYLTIKASPDRKIKFYSWDDRVGGTWHAVKCVAQFRADNGEIVIQSLNTGNEAETGAFTDSKIYEVHEISIQHKTHYLTFASGTHGSGHQHQVIQIFTLTDNELVKCKSCFQHHNDLVIEYPRSEKANLVFDPEKNEISYSEFKWDTDTGFYKPTGQVIVLKLVDGVFTNN